MSTISASTTTTTAYKVTADTTGALAFQTGSGPTTNMTLDASGNLGVGTSTDTARLNIYTAASETQIKVRADSGQSSTIYFTQATSGFNGYINYNNTSNYLRFATNGAEAARIDSSGNLLVGTTSSSSTSGYIQTISSGSKNAWVNKSSVSGTHWIASFNNVADTQVGSITANNANTTYATSSDYRLKNTIVPMTGALAKVCLLKPVTYKWNIDNSDGEGFIAHELAEVCPNAVIGEKDAIETYIDNEGVEQIRPKYQGIDTSFLVATLTAAIQEIKADLDATKAELATLKGQA